MKRLLTTAATALVLGTSAFAESHSAMGQYEFQAGQDFYASDLIGMRIYSSEAEVDASMEVADGAETEWDDIGEINDLIVDADGKIQAVIIGVGGFLGIGEKDVAMTMDQIKILREEGDSNDRFLVVNASQEMLENAPSYERDMAQADMADDPTLAETNEEVAEGAVEEAPAEDAEMAEDRMMLTPPDVRRDGYATTMHDELNTEDLTGARVYGLNDEDVGEIGELIVDTDGQIEKAVIDVGGFLGIGEKHIAVTLDELNIQRSDDGADLRVYIDSTQEALEQQPSYEG